jgi:hypothetical protein
LEDFEDYSVLGCRTEGFLEVGVGSDGTLRNVGEDLMDLKDFVEVSFTGWGSTGLGVERSFGGITLLNGTQEPCFYSTLTHIASCLTNPDKAISTYLEEEDEEEVDNLPFFSLTMATFVSLIWFEGWIGQRNRQPFSLHQGEGNKAKLDTWLIGIVNNKCVDGS